MYNTRVKYERELQALLEKEGYVTMRSAGSHGSVDLFAVSDKYIKAIQVKSSTLPLLAPSNIQSFKSAIMYLQTLPDNFNILSELWVRTIRSDKHKEKSGWRYITVNDAPVESKELLKYIREADWKYYDSR